MNRVLCIDHGKKRHGLALSDGLRLTARPLGSLERPPSRAEEFARIREIVEREGVNLLVVGLPYNMDGTPGTNAPDIVSWARALTDDLGVDIVLQDERLTTVEAERHLRNTGRGPGKRTRGEVDAVAAAVILRDFLEALSRGQSISPPIDDLGNPS